MRVIEGRITVVQESRFQLVDDGGVGHSFTLGPNAAAEPDQLEPLARSQVRVRVHASTGDGILGAIAHRIDV